MADEPKIILDPPPAAPRDVEVTPDPAPRQPFNVPTTPDPGPRAPFDVKVSPDPGPTKPFQVPIVPDPAPRQPFDVSVTHDPGPAVPFNVNTSPDPAPRQPFDVSVVHDGPPATPFQVITTADPAPRTPFQVGITFDPPPAKPFQVPITPDLPPGIVPTHGDAPPTIQQIVNAVGRFDHTLGAFLNGILEINPVSMNGPGGGALDPTNLARWLKDYVSQVGAAGAAKFISEQSVLYGMNPVVARIFDPTYFLKMLVPGSMGNVMTAADVEAGLTMERVANTQDDVLRNAVNINPSRPEGNGLSGRPDTYGPENTFDQGQDFSVDEMVDAAVDNTGHPFLTFDSSVGVKRFDASKYFEPRGRDGAMLVRGSTKNRAALGLENVRAREPGMAASAFIEGVIPASIAGEGPDGAIYTPTPDPSGIGNIDDDDARVPLSFTDLRIDPSKLAYRSVYFRPLNLSFNTSLAPEHQEVSSFGRVDPTVSYVKTTRTISLSFEVHAFAPEDLQVMYNKLYWLESMCYPSYTNDSLFQSGPVCRLRIGDAVGTSAGGLSGVIRNLSIDYADVIWEIRNGMKVPRSFKVQVDFLALHDGPVGLLNGRFGVFKLPPNAVPDKDTNNPDGPTDSRSGVVASRPTFVPGGFARFGEPVKKG